MMIEAKNFLKRLRGDIMATRLTGRGAPLSAKEKTADKAGKDAMKNRTARRRAMANAGVAEGRKMRAGAR